MAVVAKRVSRVKSLLTWSKKESLYTAWMFFQSPFLSSTEMKFSCSVDAILPSLVHRLQGCGGVTKRPWTIPYIKAL
jgi:hypothetical protein